MVYSHETILITDACFELYVVFILITLLGYRLFYTTDMNPLLAKLLLTNYLNWLHWLHLSLNCIRIKSTILSTIRRQKPARQSPSMWKWYWQVNWTLWTHWSVKRQVWLLWYILMHEWCFQIVYDALVEYMYSYKKNWQHCLLCENTTAYYVKTLFG